MINEFVDEWTNKWMNEWINEWQGTLQKKSVHYPARWSPQRSLANNSVCLIFWWYDWQKDIVTPMSCYPDVCLQGWACKIHQITKKQLQIQDGFFKHSAELQLWTTVQSRLMTHFKIRKILPLLEIWCLVTGNNTLLIGQHLIGWRFDI